MGRPGERHQRLRRAAKFARAQHGKPYVWGGRGARRYDCSGFMGAIENSIRGVGPYFRRYRHAQLPRRRPARVGAQPPVTVPGRHHPCRRRPHRRNTDGRQRREPRIAWRHRGPGRPRIPLRPVPVQVRVRACPPRPPC
ncbi:C40 family peptidase [Nocardiopsis sp. CNT-189]